ncbi:MAG: hypothetical protein ACD_19C00425G0010 [uncultured bacterium]|nr:MAG: hypothetical protein ACD_19C00425G0010 [uncultured bacterium]
MALKKGEGLKNVKTIKVSNLIEAINAEVVKDQITSLRMEMTHYVTESIAVSILALLLFIGAPSVFPEVINPYLPSSLKIMQAFVAIPSVFWLITILGNMVRYFKILRLQELLSSKK